MQEIESIDAQERLKTIESIALGTGSVKESTSKKILRELKKAASGWEPRRLVHVSPMLLSMSGIGLEIREGKEKDGAG